MYMHTCIYRRLHGSIPGVLHLSLVHIRRIARLGRLPFYFDTQSTLRYTNCQEFVLYNQRRRQEPTSGLSHTHTHTYTHTHTRTTYTRTRTHTHTHPHTHTHTHTHT